MVVKQMMAAAAAAAASLKTSRGWTTVLFNGSDRTAA
jgi:hypothetical protein